MGGHKEDPLSPILGEEGPGDGGSFPSRAANGGVGENQCNHSSGGPGDHGPADGGVTSSLLPHRQHLFLLLDKKADTPHTHCPALYFYSKAG